MNVCVLCRQLYIHYLNYSFPDLLDIRNTNYECNTNYKLCRPIYIWIIKWGNVEQNNIDVFVFQPNTGSLSLERFSLTQWKQFYFIPTLTLPLEGFFSETFFSTLTASCLEALCYLHMWRSDGESRCCKELFYIIDLYWAFVAHLENGLSLVSSVYVKGQ